MAGALLEKIKSFVGIYDDPPPYEPRGNGYSNYSQPNADRQYGDDRGANGDSYYADGEYTNDDDQDNGTLNEQFRNQGSGRTGGGYTGGSGRAGVKNGPNNIINLNKPQNYVLVSAKPDHLDDAQLVCDHLKERHVVIVNVEGLDGREAQRIVDFIGGAVYALDGEIFDITNRIFAVAPNYVDLVSIQRDTKSKGFFSYGNSGNFGR